ncbi:MAG: hypothetical protein ACLUKN_09110 [Bacilli bacterium]
MYNNIANRIDIQILNGDKRLAASCFAYAPRLPPNVEALSLPCNYNQRKKHNAHKIGVLEDCGYAYSLHNEITTTTTADIEDHQ